MAEKPASPAVEPARVLPSHLILLGPWKLHPAGRVFPAVPDLVNALDKDGVGWREATAFERSVG